MKKIIGLSAAAMLLGQSIFDFTENTKVSASESQITENLISNRVLTSEKDIAYQAETMQGSEEEQLLNAESSVAKVYTDEEIIQLALDTGQVTDANDVYIPKDKDGILFAFPNEVIISDAGVPVAVNLEALRTFSDPVFNLICATSGNKTTTIKSTEDLELIRLLPKGTNIDLLVTFGENVSLKPLEGFTFTRLSIDHANWKYSNISLESLNTIDFNGIKPYYGASLSSKNVGGNGLTNDDIRSLDPMYTKLMEARPTESQQIVIGLQNQCVFDFSYFSKFDNLHIFAPGQYTVSPYYGTLVKVGSDVVLKQYVIAPDGTFVKEPSTSSNSVEKIVTNDNGTFTVKNAQRNGGSAFIRTQDTSLWPEKVIYGTNTLSYGGWNYHSVRWYDTDLFVKYVDQDGEILSLIKEKRLVGMSGMNYDVSTEMYTPDIEGYTLDVEKTPLNAKGIMNKEDIICHICLQEGCDI